MFAIGIGGLDSADMFGKLKFGERALCCAGQVLWELCGCFENRTQFRGLAMLGLMNAIYMLIERLACVL